MTGYRLRYFLDFGSGICLWSANDAARERFGYPVELGELPLSENTRRRGSYILAWYDTGLNWDSPNEPSPWRWDREESDRFNGAVRTLLEVLRRELGPAFEIVDEFHPLD